MAGTEQFLCIVPDQGDSSESILVAPLASHASQSNVNSQKSQCLVAISMQGLYTLDCVSGQLTSVSRKCSTTSYSAAPVCRLNNASSDYTVFTATASHDSKFEVSQLAYSTEGLLEISKTLKVEKEVIYLAITGLHLFAQLSDFSLAIIPFDFSSIISRHKLEHKVRDVFCPSANSSSILTTTEQKSIHVLRFSRDKNDFVPSSHFTLVQTQEVLDATFLAGGRILITCIVDATLTVKCFDADGIFLSSRSIDHQTWDLNHSATKLDEIGGDTALLQSGSSLVIYNTRFDTESQRIDLRQNLTPLYSTFDPLRAQVHTLAREATSLYLVSSDIDSTHDLLNLITTDHSALERSSHRLQRDLLLSSSAPHQGSDHGVVAGALELRNVPRDDSSSSLQNAILTSTTMISHQHHASEQSIDLDPCEKRALQITSALKKNDLLNSPEQSKDARRLLANSTEPELGPLVVTKDNLNQAESRALTLSSDMPALRSLAPKQFLALCQSTITNDDSQFRRLLQLSRSFDDSLIKQALRSHVSHIDLLSILQTIANMLKLSVHESESITKKASDEDLCSLASSVLDALGPVHFIMSPAAAIALEDIRSDLHILRRRVEEAQRYAALLGNFLLKHQVRRGNVQGTGKGEQASRHPVNGIKLSARAAAHKRVNDIGSAYTIDTLVIQ